MKPLKVKICIQIYEYWYLKRFVVVNKKHEHGVHSTYRTIQSWKLNYKWCCWSRTSRSSWTSLSWFNNNRGLMHEPVLHMLKYWLKLDGGESSSTVHVVTQCCWFWMTPPGLGPFNLLQNTLEMCLSESGCIQWQNTEFDLTQHRCVAHTSHSECLDAGGAECDLGCLGGSFLSPQQSFTVQGRAEFTDHFITVTLRELTFLWNSLTQPMKFYQRDLLFRCCRRDCNKQLLMFNITVTASDERAFAPCTPAGDMSCCSVWCGEIKQ